MLATTRISARSIWTFKRKHLIPPLQKPLESPYIVGPHLKPDYLPREYITDRIEERKEDDFNYFIYEPTKIEDNEERKITLLLLDDVEEIGIKGEVVEVPYRSAKLVTLKKAEYATDFTRKWYEFGEKTVQSASTALSPKTIRLLKGKIFSLPIRPDCEIKPWHLLLTLRLSGLKCPNSALDEKSIRTETVDDRTYIICTITINNHEKVDVKFTYSFD